MSRPEVPIAPAVLPRLDAIPPPVEIDPPPPRGNRVRWVIASVLGVMALAAGAYVAYDIFGGGSETTTGTVATTTPADAAVVATANNKLPDIGEHPRPHPGSGRAEAPVDAKPAPLGDLKVTSTPPGARVYIDGADSGTTPLTLPGTPDTHTIGVFLAGHELYTGRIDGHGKVAIDLPEVTPTGGWAGIKVVRCRHKERYYVFVDGKPTGMTCPTERIHTVKGHHTVEVYDLVTETRQKWEINIKQQKFSHRVRIGG
jgi:hypothetical protein